MPHNHTSMVIIASEQAWPNLQSIAWFRDRGELDRVFIYHTADQLRSRAPAERMRAFCTAAYPGLEVVLPERGLSMDPAAVASQLTAWRMAHPESTRWVVNATGGTKLIFAGCLSVLTDPCWEAIYCERGSGWSRLESVPGPGLSATLMVPGIPDGVLDGIPVLDLIRTQYASSRERSWDQASVPDCDLERFEELLKTATRNGWRWKEAVADVLRLEVSSSGAGFEVFLALAIRALGLAPHQVGLNVMETNPDSGNRAQEIDVVANNGGRLVLFDCKLLDQGREGVSAFTSHVKASHDTARALGGLNAACVIVRPNRAASPDEMLLASAWNIELLDLRRCRRVFTHLGPMPFTYERLDVTFCEGSCSS
jgi:hypothetical protein